MTTKKKPKESVLDDRFQLCLTSEMRAAWQAAADEDERALGAWIRVMVERARELKPAVSR